MSSAAANETVEFVITCPLLARTRRVAATGTRPPPCALVVCATRRSATVNAAAAVPLAALTHTGDAMRVASALINASEPLALHRIASLHHRSDAAAPTWNAHHEAVTNEDALMPLQGADALIVYEPATWAPAAASYVVADSLFRLMDDRDRAARRPALVLNDHALDMVVSALYDASGGARIPPEIAALWRRSQANFEDDEDTATPYVAQVDGRFTCATA